MAVGEEKELGLSMTGEKNEEYLKGFGCVMNWLLWPFGNLITQSVTLA